MGIRPLLLLLAFCLLPGQPAAQERRFQATIDEADWRLTEGNVLVCRLEHEIPRFGRISFVREAGRALRLELASRTRFAKGINVELRSEVVSWKAGAVRDRLGYFETNGHSSLFEVSSELARRVLAELHDGFQPSFLFYADRPLVASLSTVRFRDAQAAFNDCIAGLYHTNYADVRYSNIYFEPDYEFASLSEEDRAFDAMLDYLQVDESIREIVVTGHADRTGDRCYNDGLSERRARYVYDLLVARGIDPQRLMFDYAGEMRPRSRGTSQKSLAANRRVTVELRR